MKEKRFNIVGIGEVLWDWLPTGKHLGGAPANFAYISKQLGNNGIVLSRVGNDEAGKELLDELKSKKLSTEKIQIDNINQTGLVKVTFANNQPSYEIIENVAWDFMGFSDNWRETAINADAVCFGALAQRNNVSQRTICEFVNLVSKLRVFDVNLRQNYFSIKILRKSMDLASVVKLNHEELPIVAEMFGVQHQNPMKAAEDLLIKFDLNLICITSGENGSVLITKNEISKYPGVKIKLADTIGAGDAFTAAMTDGILRGLTLDEINEKANRIAAFVATKEGAMPEFPKDKVY